MLNLFDLFYSIDEKRRFGDVATFQYVSPLFLILTYVSCELKIMLSDFLPSFLLYYVYIVEYCLSTVLACPPLYQK